MHVIAADADSYSVRFTYNETKLPYVVTLTTAGAFKAMTPDNPSDPAPTSEQLAAASAAIKEMVKYADNPRWRVGSTREVALQMPTGEGKTADIRARATLRQITTVANRLAAEISFAGSGSFATDDGTAIVMRMSGTQWTDLRTGVVLRSFAKGDGRSTVAGQPWRMEMEVEEMLDLASSAGL